MAFVLYLSFIVIDSFAKNRTLSWVAPTTYTDGSAIDNTDAITYYGYIKDISMDTISEQFDNVAETSFIFQDNVLKQGFTYAFWVKAKSQLHGTLSEESSIYVWKVPYYPVLTSPVDNATGVPNPVTFTWQAVTGAKKYRLVVDNDADFSSPEVNVITGNTSWTGTLSGSTLYHWRVRDLR